MQGQERDREGKLGEKEGEAGEEASRRKESRAAKIGLRLGVRATRGGKHDREG